MWKRKPLSTQSKKKLELEEVRTRACPFASNKWACLKRTSYVIFVNSGKKPYEVFAQRLSNILMAKQQFTIVHFLPSMVLSLS